MYKAPSYLKENLPPNCRALFSGNIRNKCNQGNEDKSFFVHVLSMQFKEQPINYFGNQSQLYLDGHQSINSTENRKILLSTIKYIKDTLRFST